MPDNPGLGLAQSEPLMRITDAVASLGRLVQQGEVPQSVKDAWEAVKKHVNDAQTSVESTAKSAYKQISDAVMPKAKAEELLTNKQGPELPKSSQPGVMSQAEFATALKAKYPKLEGYTDDQIVRAMIKKRPDIADKVENPERGDAMAAAAQSRLEQNSKNPSYIDPEAWQKHPIMRDLISGATGTLPGVGAVAGGMLAGPETMGLGSLPAAIGGAGVGAGARDYIDMLLGLSQTTPLQKTGNILGEAGLAGITPGLTEAILSPKQTIKEGAKKVLDFEERNVPSLVKWLTPGRGFLADLANMDTSAKVDPLVKPAWQKLAGQEEAPITTKLKLRLNNDGSFTNLDTGEVINPSQAEIPKGLNKITLHLGNYLSGDQ